MIQSCRARPAAGAGGPFAGPWAGFAAWPPAREAQVLPGRVLARYDASSSTSAPSWPPPPGSTPRDVFFLTLKECREALPARTSERSSPAATSPTTGSCVPQGCPRCCCPMHDPRPRRAGLDGPMVGTAASPVASPHRRVVWIPVGAQPRTRRDSRCPVDGSGLDAAVLTAGGLVWRWVGQLARGRVGGSTGFRGGGVPTPHTDRDGDEITVDWFGGTVSVKCASATCRIPRQCVN